MHWDKKTAFCILNDALNSLVCWKDKKWMFKVGATGMRYFAKSKRSKSLVLKKTFSLIWQVAFKLGYLFCQ